MLAIAALTLPLLGGSARLSHRRFERQHSPDAGCRIEPVVFEGWQAQEITNRWLKLVIVPRLGGRLMQATFAGHSFLFVNAKYRGQHIPPSEDTRRWINYGGDKIWPMPEGGEDAQHWPGPYSGVLDDGEYVFRDVSQGGRCTARLEGPADARTGLQYSREISIDASSAQISFRAEMKNVSDHPVRWSVQSVTQYDTADSHDVAKWNHDFWAFAPANPASGYVDGFHVRSGLAEDPSFSVRDGMFRLHWLNLQSEVWVDSSDGWVAIVDGASRFAMVERFAVDAKAEYPGKASVIFYKNGPAVEVNSEGVAEVRTSAEDAPFYMEAELDSPMVGLAPGESYSFHTRWQPTRGGAEFKTVTDAGVVLTPLAALAAGDRLKLIGKFGVFFRGKIVAIVTGDSSKQLAEVPLRTVDPIEEVSLQIEISAPNGAQSVSLRLIDEDGHDRGSLGNARIAPATRGG
jgi:hypothetical protein